MDALRSNEARHLACREDYENLARGAAIAIAGRPDDGSYHREATYAFAMLGQFDRAFHHAEEAARLLPNDGPSQYNLGIEMLRSGRWEEGWRALGRLQSLSSRLPPPGLSFPEWRGEPVVGAKLLLIGEQGLGDQIQLLRVTRILAERGATVDVVVGTPLWRLAAQATGVRTAWTGVPPEDYDRWCRLFRAAERAPLAGDGITAGIPYLSVDAGRIDFWRHRLASLEPDRPGTSKRKRIGLVWSGNPLHASDRHRSLTLSHFTPLLERFDVTWIALQHGVGPAESPHLPADLKVHFLGREAGCFSHTQALMHELDLLISVDTSAVHLAGASGFPVWVLVSAATDWRWMTDGPRTPWYSSVRIFRQKTLDEWDDVFAEVSAALADFLARPGP